MPNHALGLASRKRKEREAGCKPPLALAPKAEPSRPASGGGNRLLAGYLAHEFLTRGTLLGKPVGPTSAMKSDPGRGLNGSGPDKASLAYADVARLLMSDGAHVPGVVNPTELARWLQK